MTNEMPTGPTPDEVAFGAASPQQPGRARRTGRALTWVAVGAIGATVMTGVAFAANNENGTSTEQPAPATPGAPNADRPGGGHGGPGGPGGRHGLLGVGGDVLHGEFVVKDGDATKTMLSQSGEVTAASSTSLTVQSTDGFTATWTLSSSTKVRGFALAKSGQDGAVADLKVGQTVNVVGTKSSATSGTATSVGIRPTDAQLEELKKNAPQRPDRGNPEAPAPSASASTSSTA